MKFLFAPLLLLVTSSCQQRQGNLKEFDFKTLKLYAPTNWKKISHNYFEGMTNLTDTILVAFNFAMLEFEMGALADNDSIRYLYAYDSIYQKKATYIKSLNSKKGIIGVNIEYIIGDRNQSTSAKIFSRNPDNREAVLEILRSVSFNKTSEKSYKRPDNSLVFRTSDDRSGGMLFALRCASCHSMNHDLTGPALYQPLKNHTKKWVQTFLTQRENITKDSVGLTNITKFKGECQSFEKMSTIDFNLLYDYMRW